MRIQRAIPAASVVGAFLLLTASGGAASGPAGRDAAPRALGSATPLRLARLFGDGMVMQRGARVPVWGWATPGSKVHVTFDARSDDATAGRDGAWRVTLPAMGLGGRHTLTVSGGSERLVVHDIVVGDVWICSGQSNMEYMLADARGGREAVASAHDSMLRHFKVPRSWAMAPESELAGGAWAPADSAHAGEFTAVGYFFARELRAKERVPIGLINATWGGTRIESWTSAKSLGLDSSVIAALVARDRADEEAILSGLRTRIGALPERDEGMAGSRALWADPALDDSHWATIPVPSIWESAGYDGMDGTAWYRTTFELSADEAQRGVQLGLGMIDDSDVSWVNGVEIGRMEYRWNAARRYDVPPNALRPGRNVITVRVEDTGGGGGIYGDSALLYVQSGATRRPLAGSWRFRVGAVSVSLESRKSQLPTVLYNKMVAPLADFPVKGVIWYQGEANADQMSDAVAYRKQLPAMIEGWRRAFRNPRMPFIWVQLPNYMAPAAEPGESSWATLRESQHATLSLPATGEAVTIDIGEAGDIHPKNKEDVGKRLALVARTVAYGERGAASAPTFKSLTRRGRELVLSFDTSSPLVVRGTKLGGFAVAGADRRFVWANARLERGKVIVSSESVADPVAVRYAWSDNPADATLFATNGLPVTPFRSDSW
ncbi:MAG TPA: sialate O-acetylesterase [Gemmatimonadaceae bacterium]|nr:sialate O-acetylesterase [Gemmatimonadaceae bacterium]